MNNIPTQTEQATEAAQNIRKITSLSEYMSRIEENRLKYPAHEYTIFYRGHADAAYQLAPSVYRINDKGESFRSVEYQLYAEMLRHSPAEFREDKNVFERLVRMQHYKLPTRLLDLTLSPLIALYFACCDDKEKDGEVILFPQKSIDIMYSLDVTDATWVGVEQSVDFSIVAADSVMWISEYLQKNQTEFTTQSDFGEDFVILVNDCVKLLDESKLKNADNFRDVMLAIEIVGNSLIPNFINKWTTYFKQLRQSKISAEDVNKCLNSHSSILNLQKEFYGIQSNFIEISNNKLRIKNSKKISLIYEFLLQFTEYIFVFPSINNDRIRHQQGAFLIFPPAKTVHWSVHNVVKEILKIKINAKSKQKILAELVHLGITRSYVFPELEKFAEDVKSRYPARA